MTLGKNNMYDSWVNVAILQGSRCLINDTMSQFHKVLYKSTIAS